MILNRLLWPFVYEQHVTEQLIHPGRPHLLDPHPEVDQTEGALEVAQEAALAVDQGADQEEVDHSVVLDLVTVDEVDDCRRANQNHCHRLHARQEIRHRVAALEEVSVYQDSACLVVAVNAGLRTVTNTTMV